VGEAVAMVIAETSRSPATPSEAVVVATIPRPPVTERWAASRDAPLVWDDATSNVCVDSVAVMWQRPTRPSLGPRPW